MTDDRYLCLLMDGIGRAGTFTEDNGHKARMRAEQWFGTLGLEGAITYRLYEVWDYEPLGEQSGVMPDDLEDAFGYEPCRVKAGKLERLAA